MLIDKQQEEFTALVQRNNRIVRNICVLFSDHSAEGIRDLYQDIVCEMWHGFHRFRKESSETTWVYRVALNTALRQHRRRLLDPLVVPMARLRFENLNVASEGNDELVVRLYDLIDRLPDDERALAYMYIDDISVRDMAAVLKVNEATVRQRIKRMKEKLKKYNYDY